MELQKTKKETKVKSPNKKQSKKPQQQQQTLTKNNYKNPNIYIYSKKTPTKNCSKNGECDDFEEERKIEEHLELIFIP